MTTLAILAIILRLLVYLNVIPPQRYRMIMNTLTTTMKSIKEYLIPILAVAVVILTILLIITARVSVKEIKKERGAHHLELMEKEKEYEVEISDIKAQYTITRAKLDSILNIEEEYVDTIIPKIDKIINAPAPDKYSFFLEWTGSQVPDLRDNGSAAR